MKSTGKELNYFSWKRFGGIFLLSPMLALMSAGQSVAVSQRPDVGEKLAPTRDGWQLVWSDEFNGPDGAALDATKWRPIKDGTGMGNSELEYYTDRPENLRIEGGQLVITARRERYSTGKKSPVREFTSARIESRGLFEFEYGRAEARIQFPNGQGLWPAFWMLGADFPRVHWPDCGEIDIMENIGSEPSMVHGTIHGPGFFGDHPLTAAYTLPNGERFADGYHVYALEWEPGEMRFYVDEHLFATQKAADLKAEQRWVFDHKFFLVVNLAVGGNWPDDPDSKTPFPAEMRVDYVRVFQKNERGVGPQSAAEPSAQALPQR